MRANLRPDDLAIDQLHIRAPSELQHRVQQQLEIASWPRTQDESWVFIRRLEVKESAQRLSHTLVQATRDSLGKAKSPNQQADVIRFANYFEMVAYLLNDLALGSAQSRWYWQRWKHLFSLTPSNAICQLFSENITELPVVSSYLYQQQSLTTVWQRISDADAAQLLNEFYRQLGLAPLPSLRSLIENTELESLTLNSKLLQPLLSRWQPVLASFDQDHPALTLALMTIALQLTPLALQHNPNAVLQAIYHYALSSMSAGSSSRASNTKQLTSSANQQHGTSSSVTHDAIAREQPDSVPQAVTETLQQESTQSKVPAGTTTATDTPTPSSTAASVSPDSVANELITGDSGKPVTEQSHQFKTSSELPQQPATSLQSATNEPRAITPASEVTLPVAEQLQSGNESFHTSQGGLLYLLNFLNRNEVQSLMGDHWQQLPNGWAWLYRLGQTLQLDEGEPLVNFICQQLGFDNPNELQQLAPLPVADELKALAMRWYAKTDVWHPQLLKLDARIEFNPSHIDLHTSINNVQLAVRLAGLDINPGWLPWLGRVVSFHYDT